MFAIKRLYGADNEVRMRITEKDREMYEWIKDFMLKTGFCSSIREICLGMGIKSTNTVHNRIDRLVCYGLLIRKTESSPVYRLAGMKYVMSEVDA